MPSSSRSVGGGQCPVERLHRRDAIGAGSGCAEHWSNINPYGTFRLDIDKPLDLPTLPGAIPGSRRALKNAVLNR
jgi:hypothetical protein